MSTYDLFLCHAAPDLELAERIAATIEGLRWDGPQLRAFLENWDLVPGDNRVVRLGQALSSARYVAVLLSPEMIETDWCRAELEAVLAADPTNRRGRLLPILVRDRHLELAVRLEIPPFLRSIRSLDFRDDKRQKREMERLTALLCGAEPRRKSRRRRRRHPQEDPPLAVPLPEYADQPDNVTENLISNLLWVSEVPQTVWLAGSSIRRLNELPHGVSYPPLIPREGRIISFSDPHEGPLSELVSGRIEHVAVAEWKSDEARWRWVVELLNRTLNQHLYNYGVRYDTKHSRFYFAAKGRKKVNLRWGVGRERCVVRPPDEDKKGAWVHHASRITFENFGSELYLAIDPTYMFTIDGYAPVKPELIPGLAAQWGGRERNGAILRNVLLWADVITQGRNRVRIPCGSQGLVIERVPRTVEIPVGLRTDHVTVKALLAFAKDDDLPRVRGNFGFTSEENSHGS